MRAASQPRFLAGTLSVTLALRSTANPKSDVEWKMYTAAKLPGPGQYEVPTGIQGMKGGKFR